MGSHPRSLRPQLNPVGFSFYVQNQCLFFNWTRVDSPCCVWLWEQQLDSGPQRCICSHFRHFACLSGLYRAMGRVPGPLL